MFKLNEIYNIAYETEIFGVSVNSKTIKKGDIFVCYKNESCDRHDFIDEATKNGAVALIVEHDVDTNLPYIVVENAKEELIKIARHLYDNPQDKLNMMAVTGTDGKTSVATILSTLIGPDKCGYIGTNGYSCKKESGDTENTTPAPETLYKYLDIFVSCGCKDVCMEASSEAMLQGRLEKLEYKCIGMTNITSEHLNHHKTLENYVLCKKEIMRLTKEDGYCILNHDDSYFEEVKEYCKGKVLSYGLGNDNDLIIDSYKLNMSNTLVKFKYKGLVYDIESPLVGLFNVYNLACAVLMGLSQGYEIEQLLANVKNIDISGRMDSINRGQDFSVIVDYAHTPNGITKLLDFAKQIDHERIIVVIGQAGERDAYKRKEVGKIVATMADQAIFCYEDPRGEDPETIINMMCEDIKDRNNYEIIVDRAEAIKHAIDIAKKGDIVFILGKGNETYQKLKTGKIYFNDEEEAIKALDNRLNN